MRIILIACLIVMCGCKANRERRALRPDYVMVDTVYNINGTIIESVRYYKR